MGLDELIDRGPIDLAIALGLGRDIAEGLAEAHDKGLVHRDLKAANIRVQGAPPRAKVLDFGIALILDDTAASEGLITSGIAGTVYAMSPEQALGRTVDHRSDLFALGGLLYQMLSARPPFQGGDLQETLEQILNREPPRIRTLRPEVPIAAELLIERLLEKSPPRRPSDTHQVADELNRLATSAASGMSAPPLELTEDIHDGSTICEEPTDNVQGRKRRFKSI